MSEQQQNEQKTYLGVNIPENIFIELKKKAAEQRRTLTDIILELIKNYLNL